VTAITRTTSAGYEISEIDLKISSFTSNTKIAVIAPLYEYFRFTQLNVECFMDGLATFNVGQGFTGMAFGVGFIPSDNADYGTANSFDDLMQFPNSKITTSGKVIRLKIPAKDLYGSTPVKWYHTATTGTPPIADSSVGTVTYITRAVGAQSLSSIASYITLRGEVEFKAPLIGGAAVGKPPLDWFTRVVDVGSSGSCPPGLVAIVQPEHKLAEEKEDSPSLVVVDQSHFEDDPMDEKYAKLELVRAPTSKSLRTRLSVSSAGR